jgi:uncharacterized protein YjbJ (UPF0337 family)
MSNAGERAKAETEKLGGKVKQTVGKAIGNQQMQAEGAAKEIEGDARGAAAKGKERVKGTVEEVAGAIKKGIGHAIDNDQMVAEGKAKELVGKARNVVNK